MVRDVREYYTLALVIICYILWLLCLWYIDILHPLIAFTSLTILIAFHSSLQHEALHGHPFSSNRLNEALVFLPLGLFIPYRRFRDTHIAHHRDVVLTDPYDDPESNYKDPLVWDNLPRSKQQFLRFNNTLLGRMLIGPFISLKAFYQGDWKALKNGEARVRRAWIYHGLGLILLFVILFALKVPLIGYVFASYFALSILKIRTFLEHRAHVHSAGRTVVIESRGPLAFLFLNNNFHAVHHSHPDLPWYQLPQKYEEGRALYLARNRGYLYSNYGAIFRRYFLKRKDEVAHPYFRHETTESEEP